MSLKISAAIRQRAKRIKLFLRDVDGVLPRLTPNQIQAD
jgi:hypothetical protein